MAWKNPWYNPALNHHTPEGFRNPEADRRHPGDLKRWRKHRKAQQLPPAPQQGYAHFVSQWCQHADLSGNQDAVWWLGHASILLRLAGSYTLIDPVFSGRASPLWFVGPRRKTPPPLMVRELPALDTVLISHNHYDHLDRSTIRKILRRFPAVNFVVPLGMGRWLRRHGAKSVTELDWWQQTSSHNLTIHAVPARHWSMRTPWDRNRSLWCGFVVQTEQLNFWFSGDSGYSERLLEIPERLGPFNLAALPTGAYAPQWFMQSHHMDPQQAVSLHQALAQPLTIPIHWGVFELADEALDEPPQLLHQEMQAAGLEGSRFSAWKVGGRLSLENFYR